VRLQIRDRDIYIELFCQSGETPEKVAAPVWWMTEAATLLEMGNARMIV
jgi:hypothetical protein